MCSVPYLTIECNIQQDKFVRGVASTAVSILKAPGRVGTWERRTEQLLCLPSAYCLAQVVVMVKCTQRPPAAAKDCSSVSESRTSFRQRQNDERHMGALLPSDVGPAQLGSARRCAGSDRERASRHEPSALNEAPGVPVCLDLCVTTSTFAQWLLRERTGRLSL